MNLFKLDIGEIATTATDVAITGAVKLPTAFTTEQFDFMVAVVAVVYEGDPR